MSETSLVETEGTYDQIFDRLGIAPEDRTPEDFFWDKAPDGTSWPIPTHIQYDNRTYNHLPTGTIVSPVAELVDPEVLGSRSIIMDANLDGSSMRIGDNVVIGNGVTISKGSVIHDSSHIGNGASIYPNVTIGESVVIGKDVAIGERVAIHDGAVIEDGADIRRNVKIGKSAVIGTRAQIYAGADIGEGSTVYPEVEVRYKRKIRSHTAVVLGHFKHARLGEPK